MGGSLNQGPFSDPCDRGGVLLWGNYHVWVVEDSLTYCRGLKN